MTVQRKEFYDDIIVGGGFAGVLTAACLASSNRKVLLAEKSQNCGGMFQTISFNGMQCFMGAHHIGGISSGNFVDKIFDRLGIRLEDYLIKTDTFGLFLKGEYYQIPMELEGMGCYIKRKFPDEKKTDEFIEELKLFQKYFNENDSEGQKNMFMRTSRISYMEYLKKYFKDSLLMQMLTFLGPGYGAVGPMDSAFSNLSLLVTYSIGAYYVKDGNKELMNRLIAVFCGHGGCIRKNTEVVKLVMEGKDVVGVGCVETETGKQIKFLGKNIVFASYPFAILEKAIPELRICKKAASLKIGPSVYRLFCVLKEYPKLDTDITYLGNYSLEEMSNQILLHKESEKLPICMICFPNQLTKIQEASYKIAMFTFLTYEEDMDRDRLIDMIKKEIPAIGEKILYANSIDRKDFQRISQTKSGSVFGWLRDSGSVLNTNSFSPVMKGAGRAFLAGNWSTDFGIFGAIRSTEKVMNVLLSE